MDDVSLLNRSRTIDVSSVSIGVVDVWRTGHVQTDAVFDEALQHVKKLTSTVGRSSMIATPDSVHGDEFTVLVHELRSDLDAYLAQRVGNGAPSSLAAVCEFNRAHADKELLHFGQEIFEMAAQSQGRTAKEYVAARQRNIEWVQQHVNVALAEHDVLVSPAYMPAWKTDFLLGHPSAGGAVTSPAAIGGLPILTIPMGLVGGLPVGLALVGAKNSEALLIAVARTIEKSLGLVHDAEWVPRFTPPKRG
jgi:amidase